MSKKFPSQDYFRYPRLGKRWRRPKGLQSKLRLKKGGSGMLVSVGYGTKASQRNTINGMKYALVSSESDLSATDAKSIIIASGVGAKKTAEIAARAKELGVKVLNMKKVKRAEKMRKAIAEKKKSAAEKAKKKESEKKGEKTPDETGVKTGKDKPEKKDEGKTEGKKEDGEKGA